jgi:hypothetical protein
MAKYFSALEKSYEKFVLNLLADIDAISEEAITENLKRFSSSYSSSTSKGKIKEFRQIVDTLTPAVFFVSYEDVRKELTRYLSLSENNISTPSAQFAEKEFQKSSDDLIPGIVTAVQKGVQSFITKNSPKKFSHYTDYIQQAVSEAQFDKKFLQTNKVSEIHPSGIGPNIDKVFVFNNFRNTKGLSDEISLALSEYTKSSSTKVTSLNALLDLGHAVGYVESTGDVLANLPKLTQVLVNAILKAGIKDGKLPAADVLNIEQVTSDFLVRTGQINNTVEVNKEFKDGFLQIFVQAGGQVLKFENSIVNRERGRIQERLFPGGSSNDVLNSLVEYLNFHQEQLALSTSKRVVEVLKNNIDIIVKGAKNFKSSPNIIDQTKVNWLEAFTGKILSNFIQDNKQTSANKNIKANTSRNAVSKVKLKSGNTSSSSSTKPATQPPRTPNLIKLQNLINAHLQDVVSANMGSGGQRNVLNYRTGRFASSAKVEKMSQSREGMITAFYSYMKNPYQTFEPGFRQGSPKTRDPKLLIAKSIREIAETSVANKLRAVSI